MTITLTLLECSSKEENPITGGEVRIAWTGGLIGVDPQKDWGCASSVKLIRWIYSPLYSLDNPELGIAENYTHSSDFTEWEFIIRKNCYFHDDPCFTKNPRKVNAYDVKYTYEFMRNSNLALEPINRIKEILVLDSFRIKFILKEPDKNFINRLDREMVYITPPEARGEYKDNFCFHPVGSGPFCFINWNEKEIVLIKNKKFWAKDKWNQSLPYFDRIVIKFFGDINQCLNAFLNNEVDIAPFILNEIERFFERSEKGVVIKKEYEDLLQVIHSPFPSLTILLVNYVDNPYLKNPFFMKALNYGINRDEIIKLLLIPRAIPACGPTLRYY
ncbi:MAG: ABC transporter substrate-binding protein, partial [candidate division WOR-3 bacterium]|nr:ABC transporter substrate-binding protein [candidate division WOR-3 bacterium]